MTEEKMILANKHITGGIPIQYAYRETPLAKEDSGWRLISATDTEEYLADVANAVFLSYDDVYEIEPEIKRIVEMPLGTQIRVMYNEDKVLFYNMETQETI